MRRFRVISLSVIFAILAIVFGLSGQSSDYFKPITDADMFKVSVKIVNSAQTSGGSGVILHSDSSGSIIETNAHVCRLIEHGGLVIAPDHLSHNVAAYKESVRDDLCLVKINANLKINISLASETPNLGDPAIVAEHPSLFPLLVSRGHFGEHEVIQVEDGTRDCTDQEKADPIMGFFCSLLGKVPNIIEREAQIVSCLISPGSSGSPVFNQNGELAGLVFAGQGQIGFGYIVPLEALQQFAKDVQHMPWTVAK